ncbi:hypothetical protein C1645_839823, partial [Glomus cerebriforme]
DDLEKQSVKHPSLDKIRDTLTYLKQYNCKETINIKILSSLDYINVKYSYKILHPRPVHNKTTSEIQRFIQDNINCLSIEIHKKYCCNSDQLLSSKLLLTEFNQEIIININSFTPAALGFLTDLFYQLFQINLNAIEIDATYETNSMEWELYAIMGVLDASNKQSIYYTYNPKLAHEECSIIESNWGVTNISERVFCPLYLQKTVIKTIYLWKEWYTKNNNTLNISTIWNPIVKNNDNYIAESDDEQHIYETDLDYLCEVLNKTEPKTSVRFGSGTGTEKFGSVQTET